MNDDQKLNPNANIPLPVPGIQVQGQNTGVPLTSSETQAQTQNPAQSIQSQPQIQGVGSVHKEQGPVREFVEKSDVELKIDKELESIGVETKSEDINLTIEHTQAGLQHSGASVPVSTIPSGKVALPQTTEKVKEDMKKTKPTDSLRGLLLEILKNIQRIGLKEQKV